MKWIAMVIAIAIIGSCFFPWVTLPSKNVSIGGFYSNTNVFGKPGIFHAFLISIALVFVLINKNWSIRAAFFVAAFHIAWALRNFVRLSACEGGLCPEKQTALYVLLICSLVFPVAVLLAGSGAKKKSLEENAQ
jgi:hypothetical protein